MATTKLKSLWDGWKNQVTGLRCTPEGHCALGWVDQQLHPELRGETNMNRWVYAESELGPRTAVRRTYKRVAAYLRKKFPCLVDESNDTYVIATANNSLDVTPKDFRRIDRLTQRQAAAK